MLACARVPVAQPHGLPRNCALHRFSRRGQRWRRRDSVRETMSCALLLIIAKSNARVTAQREPGKRCAQRWASRGRAADSGIGSAAARGLTRHQKKKRSRFLTVSSVLEAFFWQRHWSCMERRHIRANCGRCGTRSRDSGRCVRGPVRRPRAMLNACA